MLMEIGISAFLPVYRERGKTAFGGPFLNSVPYVVTSAFFPSLSLSSVFS